MQLHCFFVLVLQSLALLKHAISNQGFIFEGIWQWPVINLVNLIHGYSCLVSLEVYVGYKKVSSFQGTQINLSVLLGKPYITYRGTRVKFQNYSET